ncbi:unnamed protein product [Amoebophrya sp. A25]|nr:unnamed protein product [Amoebophrya sp. A25]|eukprot:GSA25T00026066001.1
MSIGADQGVEAQTPPFVEAQKPPVQLVGMNPAEPEASSSDGALRESGQEGKVAIYDWCDSGLQRYFEAMGRYIAKYPWRLIAGTFFIAIALAAGQAVAESEERPERLWIPDDAQALDDVDWVDAQWPGLTRNNFALTRCKGCNMLTKSNLDLLWRKYYQIYRVEVIGDQIVSGYTSKYDGQSGPWTKYAGYQYVYDFTAEKPDTATRNRQCKVNSGACVRRDVFALLGADYSNVDWFNTQTDASILNTLNTHSEQNRVSAVLGGVSRDAGGLITAAEVVSGSWELKMEAFFDEKDGNRRKFPVAELWERDAMCILGQDSLEDRDKLKPETSCSGNKLPGPLETRVYFGRSLSDEFSRTIGGDQALIGVAVMLIVIYLVCMLGKRDSVHSMTALAFGSVLSVLLACSAGLGLAYYCGVKDTVLRFNIYFLILGLGVDDAFVLVAEFNRVMKRHPHYTDEEKIASVVKYGGMSILVTSLTDAVAFFIGATSSVPALRYFCFYAAFSVTFCFIFQLTLFLPCLVINMRRTQANRVDCLCCITAKEPHDYYNPTGFCGNQVPGCRSEPVLPKIVDSSIRTLMTTGGKAFALTAFLALLCASAVGLANQKADFQLEWFFPADSYVVDYFDWSNTYFAQGTRAAVYIRNPQGMSEAALKTCAVDLENYMQSSKYFDQNQMRPSWVKSLTDYVNADNSRSIDNFYVQLKAWEATVPGVPGTEVRWVSDADPSQGISAIKISNGVLRKRYIDDGVDRWNTMEALRSEVENVCGNAFPFSFEFLWWEEVGYTGPEFVRNALICSVCILLIVFAMIPTIRVNIPVIISIVSTILNVVGFYHWYGEPINGVISIYTVICIGLAVDYSAHIGHMFRHSKETTGNTKAVDAMDRIGISVFNALMSTLLAVMVLSGSSSYVFSVFFKVLVLVVVFGFFNALIVLPVLLSIFNGGACENGIMPVTDDNVVTEKPKEAFELEAVKG